MREGYIMKRGIIFLLCFIQLIYISTAFAQSTQITNGLNYLSSTQNPDGSWSGTVIRGMFPTTVASIETLSLLGQGNTAGYSNAVTWLQSHNLETTDYLAERIHALSTPERGFVNRCVKDLRFRQWEQISPDSLQRDSRN